MRITFIGDTHGKLAADTYTILDEPLIEIPEVRNEDLGMLSL